MRNREVWVELEFEQSVGIIRPRTAGGLQES